MQQQNTQSKPEEVTNKKTKGQGNKRRKKNEQDSDTIVGEKTVQKLINASNESRMNLNK